MVERQNKGVPASPSGHSGSAPSPDGLGHSESVPNAAFTPGPWNWHPCYDPTGKRVTSLDVSHPGGHSLTGVAVIASVFGNEANANLIAAAPSLYRALKRIAEGDEPREIGRNWRADGVPSKHDACTHGRFFYEDCGNCTSEFAASVLAASGIEAPSGVETGNTGSTVGESPTAESGDAHD